jgi:hypothetical protein
MYACLTIHMSSFIACVVVTQDLHLLLSQKEALAQKAVQDAVAKTAQEKQKAAVQAESAVKVSLIKSGLN